MKHHLLLYWVFLAVFSSGFAQQGVDFISGTIDITVDPYKEFIKGSVGYTFETSLKGDSIVIDARDLTITSVKINGKKTDHNYDGKQLMVYKKYRANKSYRLKIVYEAYPKKAVYFLGWDDKIPGNNQVWTQGQGKYSSHWVPSFDDMSEKLVFDLQIAFNKEYELAANGQLVGTGIQDSIKTWKYSMKDPMSSYLLAFAAGSYQSEIIHSSSGIPIQQFYYTDRAEVLEPTYRYTKEIMDFLEDEIGVPYPWQNYKQLPARDFLYAGMENTGTTIFSDGYLIDSLAFPDRNYVEINAHEMAHQWFGNLVTEFGAKDHWLHEGFATYYSLLARKEIFGEDFYYWKLFEMAERLAEGKAEALTDPSASSLTFYEKGAWALVFLRDRVGDAAFKTGVRAFLKTYAFSNAGIADLMKSLHPYTDYDLGSFEAEWLQSVEFPKDNAINFLREHNSGIRDWHLLRRELTTSAEANEVIIKRYWNDNTPIDLKKRILSKFTKSLSVDFLKEIFDSGEPELRKMLAVHLERIPPELKTAFESLLDDDSYISRENALFKLWIYFPSNRAAYLDRTRDIVGLPNYNIRILWLFLAILTQEYETPEARATYREELFGYTSPRYPYEIRQNAFSVITEVFELPDQNLKDLVNASVHKVWQFRSFSRQLLSGLLK
ncbi:MAG: M1 family metallopeptidase, partial [Flavobacteriaceae bacterium]